MADTQEQSLSLVTLAAGDYIRVVHSPGGTPESANITDAGLKTYLKAYNDTLYYGKANVVYVTSDFSKTSDTTLADVPGLTHTLASGGKYRFTAMLLTSCHASGGAKVALSGTATATTTNYGLWRINSDLTGAMGNRTALGDSEFGGTTGDVKMIRIDGYINVNSGGTLLVRFAQNASYATASIVLTGSWFEVDKIG